jgi:hypothetical protein
MEMTKEQELLLNWLLSATTDGKLEPAFEELGRHDPEAAGLGIQDIREIIHAGKLWWTANEPILHQLVCGNQGVQLLARDPDTKDVVLAVAAAIGQAFGALQIIAAAVIVARLGLQRWCKWNQ